MAEKVTKMKLKVNLQCSKCYKKVKKVLSKFPQIRTQEYDDKQNIVTITVVCCNPEKIRDEICCKGGGAIKTIEIVEPKPPPTDGKPPPTGQKPPPTDGKPPPTDGKPPIPDPKLHVPKVPPCIPGGVSVGVSVGVCCVSCYEGHPGGPCFHGYGGPTVVCDGYCRRPVCESYGGGRPHCVSRCEQYFSEENPSGCSIM